MQQNNHYSKGQNYTKIWLNVYKSPTRKVVMTSFCEYNVGFQAYQQMPWMVNFDGVGIWSQSGKLLGHECINVYGPSTKQQSNVLLVVYAMYISLFQFYFIYIYILFNSLLFVRHHTTATDNSISVLWPSKYFDHELRFYQNKYQISGNIPSNYEYPPSWWFGVRNDCYIGVYCSKPTTEDKSERKDYKSQVIKEIIES